MNKIGHSNCNTCYYEIGKLVLAKCASVQAGSTNGLMPLHVAALNGSRIVLTSKSWREDKRPR